MNDYACADPKKCGVKRHRASNTNPVCGATPNGTSKVVNPMTKMAPSRPVRRDSFPVTKSTTADGGTSWEFPVSTKGFLRAATVTRPKGSSFMHISMTDPDGEFNAELIPTDARGSVSDGYLVAIPVHEPAGHAVVAAVRASESPTSAGSSGERVRRLETDSNWAIDGQPTLAHSTPSDDDERMNPSLPATEERILAAAKAARSYAVLGIARNSMRQRAVAASMSQTDAEGKAHFDKKDADLREILDSSTLSLDSLTV